MKNMYLFLFLYFVQWPTNAQLINKLSHSYMFRHCSVILREFVVSTLPSYTSMSKAGGRQHRGCIINKPLLLHLVGCLYYLYQWCTVKQILNNEIYLLIKCIKTVVWRVAKRLSYKEETRCLKVKLVRRLHGANNENWEKSLSRKPD